MKTGDLFATRWRELVRVFLKLGATSFGGPAIIGIIQAELQERRGWVSKERFLEGLALVNMLPGGAVMQLCIFIGYQRAGWRGGVLAGLSFLLPPFCIMLALTILYASYGALPVMRDALYGLGPVVLGIFAVTAIRSVAYSRGFSMPASPLGKIKMVAQVVAILALILGHGHKEWFMLLGQAALWVVVVAALVSAADYFRRFNLILSPRVADFTAARARRRDRGAPGTRAEIHPRRHSHR